MVSVRSCFSGFKALDFLAPNVSLNVAGSSGVKTHLGAFLTLIASGLFTLMSVVIIHAYVRTDNPSVTQEVRYKTAYPKIDFLQHKLMPVIFPYLEDVTPIANTEMDRYFTVVANKARYTTTLNDDGSQVQVIDKVQMYYRSCGDLIDEGKNLLYLPNQDAGMIHAMTRKFGLCVEYNETESYVQGRISDLVYEEIYIEVYPCLLEDTTKCATVEELQLVSFIYATASANTDLSNKKHPISHIMTSDDYFYLNTNIGIQYQARFMENSIYDDLGYYFGATKVDSFFSIEKFNPSVSTRDATKLYCTKQEVIDDECGWYYSFMFISGGREAVITRTYKDLVSTIGDIGGVKEFVFLIFAVIYSAYNSNQKKKDMVRRIYHLQQDSSRLKIWCACKRKDVHQMPASSSIPGSSSQGPDESVKKVPRDVIDSAFDIIEDSLDAITIVEQLNIVKFIAHFLMQEYQKNLVPLVALNHDLQKAEDATKLSRLYTMSSQATAPQKRKQSGGQSLDRSFQVLQLEVLQTSETGPQADVSSSQHIQLSNNPPGFGTDSIRQIRLSPKTWDRNLRLTIDKYCYDLLCDSLFFSNLSKKGHLPQPDFAPEEPKSPDLYPFSRASMSSFKVQKSVLKGSQHSISYGRPVQRKVGLPSKHKQQVSRLDPPSFNFGA